MGALAPWHWAVLILVILIVFGGGLLPRLGRFFGKSVTSFRQGLKDSTEEFKAAMQQPSSDKPEVPEKSDTDPKQ